MHGHGSERRGRRARQPMRRKRGHGDSPLIEKESKMQIGEPKRIYEIPEPEPIPDHAPDDEPARVPERHEPAPG